MDGLVPRGSTGVLANADLPTMLAPIVSPRVELQPSSKNEECHNDGIVNLTNDGMQIERKYPHLLALSTSQLELLNRMANAKELEDLLECSLRWKTFQEQLSKCESENKTRNSIKVQEGVEFGKGHEVDELKRKLDQAIQENVHAQSKVKQLKRIVHLDKCMPKKSLDSRWLVWAQKLQDKSDALSRAMKGLLKLAMKSKDECNAVESFFWHLKQMFELHLRGSTDITYWGDVDAMFERLNHTKKEEDPHINWTLELEEGWIPYNTFSAHIKKNEKAIVHACDPSPGLLTAHCSLC